MVATLYRDGMVRRAYALLSVALLGVFFLLVTSSAVTGNDGAVASASTAGDLSVYDLISIWGGAMVDPSTYTTLTHVDGFFTFVMNETFLSSLSSNSFSSLSRNSILGSIPNIFFVVCIICVLLSVAVAVVELKKLDLLKRIVKK